eukprot:Nitzschia sp. Nitz4//scaffold49_size126201//42312//46233//NITZ4_003637-RA/size126201-processed-gene-0.137-mRNA-1//1//CDS//3329553134//5882//frame0
MEPSSLNDDESMERSFEFIHDEMPTGLNRTQSRAVVPSDVYSLATPDSINSQVEYSSPHTSAQNSRVSRKDLEDESLAVAERKFTNLIVRVTCAFLLLICAIFLAIWIARLSTGRYDTFLEDEFLRVAARVVQSAQSRHLSFLDALQTMSLTATLMAKGQSWPFVTLDDFEVWTNRAAIEANSVSLVVLAKEYERGAWIEYSNANVSLWMGQDLSETPVVPYIWREYPDRTTNSTGIIEDWRGEAAIHWQSTPVNAFPVNFNLLTDESPSAAIARSSESGLAAQFVRASADTVSLLQPVKDADDDVVAYLLVDLHWSVYFRDIDYVLDEGPREVGLYVEDTCDGRIVELDLYYSHIPREVSIDEQEVNLQDSLFSLEEPLNPHNEDTCGTMLHVFATRSFHSPEQLRFSYLALTAASFVLCVGALVLLAYDVMAHRRQARLAKSAKKSLAIVDALFPSTVRDRILEKDSTHDDKEQRGMSRLASVFATMNIHGDHHDAPSVAPNKVPELKRKPSKSTSLSRRLQSKPIADLFPQVTVLFADIEGFTAWSSVREPSQVFILLESVFESLDVIAKRLKVFKASEDGNSLGTSTTIAANILFVVETIGDCYVAVAGLPEPRPGHAVVMANFSKKALEKFSSVVHELDPHLGPGTAELSMRFGLHSGPVMAGVLRGQKSRFQLFGDTMNTAARIEATGVKNKIHLSQQTAELIIKAGKEHWVEPRDKLVAAKGKGQLKTFWLRTTAEEMAAAISEQDPNVSDDVTSKDNVSKKTLRRLSVTSTASSTATSVSSTGDIIPICSLGSRFDRLIEFNTQVLHRLLKQVVAQRMRERGTENLPDEFYTRPAALGDAMDEIVETIDFPVESHGTTYDEDSIELPAMAKNQLRLFVIEVASMYRDVPFHGFEHASHVVMSVTKLLARVVVPESPSLHISGFQSDPLTHFTVAVAALIHDLDHTGVPNAQLVKEGSDLAAIYRNQSVAEQHSIQLAWDLLMRMEYDHLRRCIYTNKEELLRFRSLLVNGVMATDIADKSLGELRRRRWDKVFGSEDLLKVDHDSANRKATIVIEHLLQASDVAHTMQHWHVYRRWNKRLYQESYLAFCNGRADKHPAEGWYEGEMKFFDFYIIPLAKKLQECGVFGVASDEYLDYAMANRIEWELKGQEIVREYEEDCSNPNGDNYVTRIALGDLESYGNNNIETTGCARLPSAELPPSVPPSQPNNKKDDPYDLYDKKAFDRVPSVAVKLQPAAGLKRQPGRKKKGQ